MSAHLFSFPNILSDIILAATLDVVIPHFLYPVATYKLGKNFENSPIYGTLSIVTQS